MEIILVLSIALLADWIFGEPQRFHPLVGFGNLANAVEKVIRPRIHSNKTQLLAGCLAWLILILPLPLVCFYLQSLSVLSSHFSFLYTALEIVILYSAIGLRSLELHGQQVYQPISNDDIDTARHFTGYLVSRDTSQLNEQECSRAVVESMLENGHDAVIASLFWYAVGGAPLVIVHRLANTLDAMWGYRTEKYLFWGRVSARMDDVLGWPSAKLTACLYGLQGNLLRCLNNATIQSQDYKSLNGGWTMASGATALQIRLGGTASYFGKTIQSVTLGEGNDVTPKDIPRSILLVKRAAWLFIAIVAIITISPIELAIF